MDIIMYGSAILAIVIIVYMLIKQMDIKITLFFIGIVLMFIGILMGNGISAKGFESSGAVWLDPLVAIADQFKSSLTSAGFIILILGGYTAYMSYINANDVTVNVLTKPLGKIKSVYILVPVVFLLGNLLSLVIPSASNLAIILLATLFPVLKKAGMSTLSAAAIIATSATIVPTPMGGDNVAIATELAQYAEYAGLTVTDYVFRYHALVSIPTLLVMAVVHYFWQKRMDKKMGVDTEHAEVELKDVKLVEGGKLFTTVYALLPVLPILFLIVVFILQSASSMTINISVEVVALLSFAIAIVCELIRKRNAKQVLDGTEHFFKGMGSAVPIVVLLVAASVFVTGLKSIGLIESLETAMTGIHGSSLGFILPLILVALTALIVILSGSGTALFYSMIPLLVPLANAAGINPIAVTVPMGLAGNLFRAVSPVAAVVLIVAGSVKKNPIEIVKRTSVPMLVGVVFMFILSMIVFL
ncbi:C4-dicarboxylate transporter DcuC [Paenibacillus sp. FSL E2-8871]|uniref:C4-dicarboxylate ABC transporter n=1 Tax=Paenibacillus odorifer TaxID=189426 RepID=A0A1R0Z9E9_9BACL|nr:MULTISPECIES: C4-dicarboxylate transporter DcuC [Paenibacillus]KAA1184262.1 TRAP transporter large permease subunit [Paenibacillus sp. B2(2019)]OMD49728.1 C4-dicarboxylate ABC transporter [Paenibacillus odorifer]OME64895.1 C4-dicarboxylate ABC transporter [Paenibacillus odorifer]